MYFDVDRTITEQDDSLNVVMRTFRHDLLRELAEAIHARYRIECYVPEGQWLRGRRLDSVFLERDLTRLYTHLQRLCGGAPTQSALIPLRRSLANITQQPLELEVVWRDDQIVFVPSSE